MRVVHVIPTLDIGGVEIAALSSLRKLNENGEAYIVCLDDINPAIVHNVGDQDRDKVIRVSGRKYSPLKLVKLLHKIRQVNPDILLVSLWRSSLLGVLFKIIFKKAILISFIHSSKFVHIFDRIFTKMVIKKADYIFCDSNSSAKLIRNIADTSKVKVISFVRNKTMPWESILTMKRNRFLYVGRITKHKNVIRSLRLIRALRNSGIPVSFDIYGPARDQFESAMHYIKDNKMEQYVGLGGELGLDNVKSKMKEYGFFLHLSDVEGMAMSVVEAMQNGLVCVVTPVGEIKHYASHMENAIVMHAPYDDSLEEVVELIRSVMSDDQLFNSLSMRANRTFAHSSVYEDSVSLALDQVCAELGMR